MRPRAPATQGAVRYLVLAQNLRESWILHEPAQIGIPISPTPLWVPESLQRRVDEIIPKHFCQKYRRFQVHRADHIVLIQPKNVAATGHAGAKVLIVSDVVPLRAI